ncbi:MAG: hypothetical protein U0324_05935 [Polyangiales bacterium]
MTASNIWVLDNNLLSFALRAGVADLVADAVDHMKARDVVATAEHVPEELKRDGKLGGLWSHSRLRHALRTIPIAVGSEEERHYFAMRSALANRQRVSLKDEGEHACIAICTTLPGAIFVSHDAVAIRLAVSEMARVAPATGRVATTSELLRALRERGALPWDAVDAIVEKRGAHSNKLPDPSWWDDWFHARP